MSSTARATTLARDGEAPDRQHPRARAIRKAVARALSEAHALRRSALELECLTGGRVADCPACSDRECPYRERTP